MTDIFGVLVAGRLVQTNLTAVSETKYFIEIPNADDVNHIVVFMTGSTPFPAGMGGAVYFCWPESGWSLLGFISNEKPSAIFKISGLKTGADVTNPFTAHSTHVAQIGISIEQASELANLTPVASTSPSNVASYTEFAQRMIENFLNFVTSFALPQSQMTPQPNETFVPLSAVDQWCKNTKRKMDANPNWWKK